MKVYVVTNSGSDTVVLGVYPNLDDAKKCFKEAFEQFEHTTDSNGTPLKDAVEYGYAYFEEEATYLEITEKEMLPKIYTVQARKGRTIIARKVFSYLVDAYKYADMLRAKFDRDYEAQEDENVWIDYEDIETIELDFFTNEV